MGHILPQVFFFVGVICLSFFPSGILSSEYEKPPIISRPTIYSGIQTTSTNPIFFGLGYFDHDDERGGFLRVRENVDYKDRVNHRAIRTDALNFGYVEISDDLHTDLKISTKWIKIADDSFAYRVTGTVDQESKQFGESWISVFLYVSIYEISNSSSFLHFDPTRKEMNGYTPEYGRFKLRTITTTGDDKEFYFANYTDSPFFMKETLKNFLISGYNEEGNPACCTPLNHERMLPNKYFHENPNIIILQKVMKTPFEWTVSFENIQRRPSEIDFDKTYEEYESAFEKKFDDAFPIQNTQNKDFREFGLRVLSSLLNGLSYFQGDAYAKDPHTGETWKLQNRELLTLIPAKIGFPRGFYWDEGFHEMVLLRFDRDLHELITRYWYALQNETTGWIAREQIIGPEAMATSPEWAWYGLTNQMNPPSFFLATEQYLQIYYDSKALAFLHDLYPKLQKVYNWYIQNLALPAPPGGPNFTYHWNGREQAGDSALDSGLDDFPRFFAFDEAEINVDLQAWIAKITKIMEKFAEVLGDHEGREFYAKNYHHIHTSLSTLFWSEELSFYVDANLKRNNVKSPHVGANGLLPFCLKLETSEERIEAFFGKLEHELSSEFGIMSLSKLDSRSKRSGNYWRGNIWLNLNYLCLDALHHYETLGFHQAKKLRERYENALVVNMYENYFERGDAHGNIYETYNPETGKGYNHHPFSGWSALILLVMTEDYTD